MRRLAISLFLVAAAGCSRFTSVHAFGSSPDGDATVTITKRCIGPPSCSLLVTLKDRRGIVEYRHSREAVPSITEMAWKGDRVIVFVLNPPGGDVLVTFDRQSRRYYPSTPVEVEEIAANLVKRYGLTEGDLARQRGDVFRWARTVGIEAFNKAGYQSRPLLPLPPEAR